MAGVLEMTDEVWIEKVNHNVGKGMIQKMYMVNCHIRQLKIQFY